VQGGKPAHSVWKIRLNGCFPHRSPRSFEDNHGAIAALDWPARRQEPPAGTLGVIRGYSLVGGLVTRGARPAVVAYSRSGGLDRKAPHGNRGTASEPATTRRAPAANSTSCATPRARSSSRRSRAAIRSTRRCGPSSHSRSFGGTPSIHRPQPALEPSPRSWAANQGESGGSSVAPGWDRTSTSPSSGRSRTTCCT